MKFLHLRYRWAPDDLSAKGGVTVAYEASGNEVKYAVSQCHHRDTFCKRLGRDISQGRFVAGKHKTLPLKENDIPRMVVREAVYEMLEPDHIAACIHAGYAVTDLRKELY